MTTHHQETSSDYGTVDTRPALTYAVMLVPILLLSTAPAVTRLTVTTTLTPYDLVFLRCVIGGLIWVPYLWFQWASIPRQLLMIGFALALLRGLGGHITSIVGLQYAPASHLSALGPGVMPIWVALWGWLFYRNQLTRGQSIGLGFILSGVVVLLVSASNALFNSKALIGDLFFLCGSALGAIYLVYISKHKLSPMQCVALISFYSAVVALPYFLFAGAAELKIFVAPAKELVLQIIYQGIIVGGAMMAINAYVMVRVGSQRFTIMCASVPALGLVFGRLIAGDGVTLLETVAVGLITTGVLYGAQTKARPLDRTPVST